MNNQSTSFDETKRKKFSGYKFAISPVGVVKLLVIVALLVAGILSLTSEVCSQSERWLDIVFPIVTTASGVVVAIFYASHVLGLAKKFPDLLVKLDISCCVSVAVITLIISILLLTNCSPSGALSIVPGVLGIVGALALIVASATLFIKWGNEEDVIPEAPTPSAAADIKRKSVYI